MNTTNLIEEKSKYCCIIAAMSENYVIGSKGSIPWNLPADRRMFRDLTIGFTVVMGRKTYESIGKALPARENIIVSSTIRTNKLRVVPDLRTAINSATTEKVFLAGGHEIYKEGLNYANHMILTVLHQVIPGDTYFPDFSEKDWGIIHGEDIGDTTITQLIRLTEEQKQSRDAFII